MKRKAVLAVMIVLILCMGLFAGCGQKDSAEAGGPPEIEGLTFDEENDQLLRALEEVVSA